MYHFDAIGRIHSCFKEKFGIPRQPGLVPEARAVLELFAPYARPEALVGLESFSHIWVVFVFHRHLDRGWRPTVRPPRLGGNRRLGVFATRSGFRPNPVGISAVRLEGVRFRGDSAELGLAGVDLLDGTPVLDIKPYLPYADALPAARGGFAGQAPPRTAVSFAPAARVDLARLDPDTPERLAGLIVQVLANDPRPAYYAGKKDGRIHGLRLYDLDVRWQRSAEGIEVVNIAPRPSPPAPGEDDPS